MLSLAGVPTADLTALQFPDRQTFYRVTEIVAALDLNVVPVGNCTIIIRRADAGHFAELPFTELRVADDTDAAPETR